MRDDARDLLLAALPAAASRMEEFNATVPASRLGETKHLQPAMEDALVAAAGELALPARLRAQHPFQCVEWRSRAGVDVGIRGLPRLAPVFCELKWGDSASVLGECSWDLAKMALAVAKRACSAGVLVAGAPRRRWTQPGLEGPELFAAGRHELSHVRGPLYLERYWQAYAREGLPQPKRLPAVMETVPLSAIEMTLDDEAWELRCVEAAPDGDLVPVKALAT